MCLHPFDRVEGSRPEMGQKYVTTVYRPNKYSTECLFVFYYFLKNK